MSPQPSHNQFPKADHDLEDLEEVSDYHPVTLYDHTCPDCGSDIVAPLIHSTTGNSYFYFQCTQPEPTTPSCQWGEDNPLHEIPGTRPSRPELERFFANHYAEAFCTPTEVKSHGSNTAEDPTHS